MSAISRISKWWNGPVLENPDEGLTLYRCTECGHVSMSEGSLHGHIEKHRPITRFWQSGSVRFLQERTEVLEYDLTDRVLQDDFAEWRRQLGREMKRQFLGLLLKQVVVASTRYRVRKGHRRAELLAEEASS